ncbi:MAG: cobalamin-dependent protein [Desulfobacterales bacterium]|nr:cobalamin-dependent protein [Desulfobacterales bacterium]
MGQLADAIRDLQEELVYGLVDRKIQEKIPPLDLIQECNQGMVQVGELFSQKKYFISQLIFSAEIFKNVMKKINPLLEGGSRNDRPCHTVVIGTVKGDIHDIGKNIAGTFLRGAGFEVMDLGVDVPPEKFVQAVGQSHARAVGLSALLNFTYPDMKSVVDRFAAEGLRDQVKIIIGGAPVNEAVRQFTGADYYANDAVAGVNLCKKIYALE